MSHIDKEKQKLIARIKRIRGQVDSIERSLTSEDDCADVLMLLANVRGGINSHRRSKTIVSNSSCYALRGPTFRVVLRPTPGRQHFCLSASHPKAARKRAANVLLSEAGRVEEDREDSLKQTPSARRTLTDGTFEGLAVGGRVLIVLMALLTAVSPWTEYYWHFDNFLHGGQDFEFSLLATITALCLVFVLLQHKQAGCNILVRTGAMVVGLISASRSCISEAVI
jgi:hypothetical protein